MFAGGLREMEQEEIHIQDISYNAMCKILNFIYTSELELGLNNVQEILAASCQLQVSFGSSKRCEMCCGRRAASSFIKRDQIVLLACNTAHFSRTAL